MTLVQQRENECLLASLCMSLGRPYEPTSDDFKARYGVAWGDTPDSVVYWATFARDVLGVELPASFTTHQVGFVRPCDDSVWSEGGILLWAAPEQSIWHATAYDATDETVYDADHPDRAPIALIDYTRTMRFRLYGGYTPKGI